MKLGREHPRHVHYDILLKAGQHAIRVEYINDFARAQLQVAWQGPSFEMQEIGKDSLFA